MGLQLWGLGPISIPSEVGHLAMQINSLVWGKNQVAQESFEPWTSRSRVLRLPYALARTMSNRCPIKHFSAWNRSLRHIFQHRVKVPKIFFQNRTEVSNTLFSRKSNFPKYHPVLYQSQQNIAQNRVEVLNTLFSRKGEYPIYIFQWETKSPKHFPSIKKKSSKHFSAEYQSRKAFLRIQPKTTIFSIVPKF